MKKPRASKRGRQAELLRIMAMVCCGKERQRRVAAHGQD
jgi:hypothetical protein